MKTKPLIRTLFLLAALSLGACSQNTEAAGKGTVKIVTDPGDARIYINGEYKGNSPVTKGQFLTVNLPKGEYRLEAVKPTGGPQQYYGQKVILVAEDKLRIVSLDLKKRHSQAFRKEMLAKYPNGVPEPEMVPIPAGSFRMGCVSGKDCYSDEKPVHRVQVPAFEMSKYEITFEQWDACVAVGGCDHLPDDEGWGRGDRPVINLSWDDAQQYIAWLNKQTGKHYRLPSEAEWEYAARAGSKSKYHFGDSESELCRYGNGADQSSGFSLRNTSCSDGYGRETAPVGSFKANRWGLHDMHGNIWEWVQDCWNDSYKGAPTDGSAWERGECRLRVLRGGWWRGIPRGLRSAYRSKYTRDDRNDSYNFGFRLARDR